jgi:ubiquinone/menaquinone biosynthesis C-methylase UbiE
VDRHQSNRAAWNEAAAFYRRGLAASIEMLRGGGHSMCAPELPYLAGLAGKRCIHLQCAGGEDTLSLLNLGAREVVGVDISEEMIGIAQEKSKALGASARWIVSDILHAPAELDGTADFVYTGRGALNWIMDIGAWARVVARLLVPGGKLYVFEGHPFTYCFDMESTALTLDPNYGGYFSGKIYESQDWSESYVGKLKSSVAEQARKFERAWTIGELIGATLEAGLVIERFEEHPDEYWKEFPKLPEAERRKIPNTFSLLARKDSA